MLIIFSLIINDKVKASHGFDFLTDGRIFHYKQ